MSLKQVIKTELYKNTHRKSSLMLLIPMLLTVIISFGYAQGIIKLNLTVGSSGRYSCMDFVFIIWNVLSGLGMIGILFILFAAFQFSGEIERGQIKIELLRIGKRRTVVIGKYIAVLLVALAAILATILACMGSYYLFVAGSSMGTGTFVPTIEGVSSLEVMLSIAMQILMYVAIIAVSFFIGIKAGPFATFILTMVIMYAVNYLAGADNVAAKLMPAHWSNQLMTNGTVSAGAAVSSVAFLLILTVAILSGVIFVFEKRDIK